MNLLRKTQLKLTPQRPLSNLKVVNIVDDDETFIVDDEITFGRNLKSKEFGKVVHEDNLSDYIKFRLWLARQLALAKYKEKWA